MFSSATSLLMKYRSLAIEKLQLFLIYLGHNFVGKIVLKF